MYVMCVCVVRVLFCPFPSTILHSQETMGSLSRRGWVVGGWTAACSGWEQKRGRGGTALTRLRSTERTLMMQPSLQCTTTPTSSPRFDLSAPPPSIHPLSLSVRR